MVGRTDRVPPLPGLATLLVCVVAALPAHAADPAAGQATFKSACSLCHSPQAGRNLTGPSLFGVIGRKTGSEAGFKYSTANQNANITWTPEILDKYLDAPRAVIPGTIMTYAGLKDQAKRADLIAYLGTLK